MVRSVAITGLLVAALLQGPRVFAQEAKANMPAHCLTTEETTIGVEFQANDKDVAAVHQKFESDIKDIQSLAESTGMTEMVAGGLNYNINPASQGEGFQLTGNVNFQTSPSSKAPELLKAIQEHGHIARLSYVVTNGVTGGFSNKCRLMTQAGTWEP